MPSAQWLPPRNQLEGTQEPSTRISPDGLSRISHDELVHASPDQEDAECRDAVLPLDLVFSALITFNGDIRLIEELAFQSLWDCLHSQHRHTRIAHGGWQIHVCDPIHPGAIRRLCCDITD